jgi:excisionase family DNA binding protein
MDVAGRIRGMIDGVPDEAAVLLPVRILRTLVEVDAGDESLGDLTVEQVAALMGRRASTVRAWIRDGRLEAYRLNKRDYRVTRLALAAFLEQQRTRNHPAVRSSPRSPARADLGAWRKTRRRRQ